MGNSQGKESRGGARQAQSTPRDVGASLDLQQATSPSGQAHRAANRERQVRGSRPDLTSFLTLGIADRDATQHEHRRETRQEREARKVEKEKALRADERQKSIAHETVDGGFLVTLGVYTGSEDFAKSTVRSLQIERRLAPFWTGLNDHEDSWTEHQLVAAARGLPIPAADAIPPPPNQEEQAAEDAALRASETQAREQTLPITARSQSVQSVQSNSSDTRSERSRSRSQSQSGFGFGFASCHPGGGAPLFRARSKTLASLTSNSRSNSIAQAAPQEIKLPKTTKVNGQLLEAYLYKDASECPICFLYYPPHLNQTRCCDQPICSECFVQIKRPDPHPPEHHVPAAAPTVDDATGVAVPPTAPLHEQADQLVSEPSQCPFCKTPEFGVTYEPPSFRSGLVYAGGQQQAGMNPDAPAMVSSTSLGSTTAAAGNRRRTTSLSAASPSVITTDRIRPDWAKKLSDARAHALRRSAAATALHNAAYVLNGVQALDPRFQAFGRRRRTLFEDGEAEFGGNDGLEPRSGGTRRARAEDLEELMMMEAIRLSLAAEEERKKKEEKEEKKKAKELAKESAKESKYAKKEARKQSKSGNLYSPSANASTSTWASTGNGLQVATAAGGASGSHAAQPALGSPVVAENTSSPRTPNWPLPAPDKGKGPAQALDPAVSPGESPGPSLGTTAGPTDDPQQYLHDSRANMMFPNDAGSDRAQPGRGRLASAASSAASSMNDSPSGSIRNGSGSMTPEAAATDTRSSTPLTNTQNTSSQEPMLNFQSLSAMIASEDKGEQNIEHVEQVDAGSRPPSVRGQALTTAEDERPGSGGRTVHGDAK